MLRSLLLLLILPTLLTPPGMCVCQFMPRPLATPSKTVPTETASHATNPLPGCTCESCNSRARSAAPAADEDGPILPPTHEPSGPEPGKHWPGCPAAVDAVPLNMVAPAVAVHVDFAATPGFFTRVAEAVVSLVPVAAKPCPSVSPPLFISHCTLLI